MKKTVSSAKIDECTKICYILNNTCYSIACMDSLHKLFLLLSFFCKKKLFAVTDNTASSRVELCDNEFNFLICIFGQISLVSIRYKACRNKYSCFLNIYTKTSVQYLSYRCFQDFLRLECSFQTFVAFFSSKSLVCQDNLTFAVVHFKNLGFHCVTYVYSVCKYKGAVVGILALGDNTVCFIADIQDNLIFFYVDDSTLHDLSISDSFYGIFQHLFKT